MRGGYRLGAVLAATVGQFASAIVARASEGPLDGFEAFTTRSLGYKPAQFRRSKNRPTKRKLRSNRLHVSKRVRRRHRRAR